MPNEEDPPVAMTIGDVAATTEHALAAVNEHAAATKQAAVSAAEDERLVATLLLQAQAKLDEISAAATKAVAATSAITDNQAVIATKSAHIQDAQLHADKVRGELDRALTAANLQVTEAEGLKLKVESAATESAELLATVQSVKPKVEADAVAVGAFRESSKESAAATKSLADRADKIESRIGEYETRLAGLEAQANAHLETIVNLLPGATSAGLAHAFDERRQTFLKPRIRWQWLFVASVLALVCIAATGLWHIVWGSSELTYAELIRVWLARLPIAGALIWLALHASHESSLAKRLEEDYGYKAAIAASFEGFNKQMTQIASTAPDTPIAKLCTDTLATIGTPPGHIYEGHGPSPTPASHIKDTLAPLLDQLKAMVGEKK